MSFVLSDYHYELPEELIATSPLGKRSASKLLVVNRSTGSISHAHFSDLPELLDDSWVIVRNNSKVIPARIRAKKPTGGAVEIFLSKKIQSDQSSSTWECLTKPGLKPGQKVLFDGSSVEAVMEAKAFDSEDHTKLITFGCSDEEFYSFLDIVGSTPLPPYIKANPENEKLWQDRYQTIYAHTPGSVAAPTAGLHMTQETEQKLIAKGIEIFDVTLHVGLGTFLPVKTNDVRQHHMHSEAFSLSPSTYQAIQRAKQAGKKVLSIGTTTTRVLETVFKNENQHELSGDTAIFIYPPYQFKIIDGLITNFHLPESTLLMLVGALCSAPQTTQEFTSFAHSLIGKAYQEAIDQQYRFFSFGDAMLIL